MATRSVLLLGLILLVMPVFSDDGPKPSDPQPEFFFTRVAYTDIWGRGPAGNETTNDFGISDDNGRLMVLVTYNSDLGDAWEWMDDPNYPAEFTGYAYRFGMNSIIYAMTH